MEAVFARSSCQVSARFSAASGEPSSRAALKVPAHSLARSVKAVSLSSKHNIARNTSSVFRTNSRAAGSARQTALSVTAEADAAPATQGTAVRDTAMLVVGATGTLGRQVVRRALDEGYDVRCIVRPRPQPADFLRDWGAQTVRADLLKPETIPPTLVGIHTVVDCSTARPEESIKDIDWEGKKALIQSAKAMGVQRYVMLSIEGCDRPEASQVPLMEIKRCTEQYLQELDMPYTILRCSGFMQALIGQYAVPILEEDEVWGTDDKTATAYLDTQDAARMTLAALKSDKTLNKTISLAGPQSYSISQVIEMCAVKADQEANVKQVPMLGLQALRVVASWFQWSAEASDRLAFAELMGKSVNVEVPMDETYELLGLDPADTTNLDTYLDDFYARILKKLKEVGGAQSRQKDFYL